MLVCISGCIRWKVDKIMQSLGHSHLLLHKTQAYTQHMCIWVLVSPSCPQTHPNRCATRGHSEAIICEVPLQFTWVDKGGCYWFSGPEGESNLSDRWGIKQTESQQSQSHWGRTAGHVFTGKKGEGRRSHTGLLLHQIKHFSSHI